MKTAVKVLGIISIVIGGLAMVGSLDPVDGYGVFGGGLFLAQGIVNLCFLKQVNNQSSQVHNK